MIFPENFEQKIGFSDIRRLLKGRCMSTLGTEWTDNQVQFLTDPAEIRESLQQAQEFVRFTETEEDVYEENFFDVRQALLRIRPERTFLEEIELFDLKRSLKTVGDLASFFTGNGEGEVPYPALARMAAGVGTFPEIVERIDSVLNKYGKIKDTASPELLSLRHSIEVTTRSISHSLRQIITEAQTDGYIDRDVAPTLRDGRLVIPVAPALKRKIRGIIHDESATGKTVFIEPAAVVEANNRIRELKASERREMMRILQELTALIRPNATAMLDSLRFLAHIDYLRALANFAQTFECIVPEVKDTPALDWVQAIHPILQQALRRNGSSQVPLDICLRGEERILLISGPNAGGKSVCLKTVGLLQYMMQCGMPVPMRENSTMGIFSDIFISIGDEQSLENSLSTYSSHLLGLKRMMKSAGPTSLLLIDEFGGGTEPQIGGALAEAILDRFVQNQAYGIITTHYQNLKHYAEQCASVANGAMLYDRAQMQPLFLLRIGHPGSSFAIEIARKIGIPEDVIAYAADLVGKDYVMSDKYLQDIARDKMYWESKRAKVHSQEKQLEQTLATYEREMEDFARQRKQVMAKAKEEAQELLRESNAKIENTIRAIKEAQAEKERTRAARRELNEFNEALRQTDALKGEIERKMEKIRRRQERKQQKRGAQAETETSGSANQQQESTTPERPFTAGDYVHLRGQSAIGRIQSITGKNAKVLFGMMHTTVPLERLQHGEAPKTDTLSKVSTFVSKETREAVYEKKLRFKPDIDLRGMRGDEALNTVSHFIDDAILLEQSRVRILHGTGTGALRELVRNYLRTVSGVKNFRDEHVQFGGAGITVVELE
ncbi:MAG: Smr/MutS family protein [Alloprevotella sp.]|nr:Smr/MutS family protein [Alloprevotella sp.]